MENAMVLKQRYGYMLPKLILRFYNPTFGNSLHASRAYP